MQLLTFEQAVIAVAGYLVASGRLTGIQEAPTLVPVKEDVVEITGTIVDREGQTHALKDTYISSTTAVKLAAAMDSIKKAVKAKT
jgi:hypothetical protein